MRESDTESPGRLDNDGSMNRREFIGKTTVAAGAAGIVSGCGKGEPGGIDDKDTGKSGSGLEYVTLGSTDMRVSKFFGDRMADRRMYELAIEAGINYWHKFGHWQDPAPYDLFRSLDRDSFYCDTTIATLEYDKAIEIFEGVLEKTGLEYIDGFKIHSRYRNADELKTETGAVRAFEQLKRQGKTRWLMMSQHINTSEVFEAAIDSDLFDVIQVPVNPTVPRDYFTEDEFAQAPQDHYLGLIEKAAARGIGITAMKVFLYGAKYWDETPDLRERVSAFLPDDESIATALIHWALAVPGVQAYGSMLYTFEELQENLEAIGGTLSEAEDRGLREFRLAMDANYCRMCGACQRANPGGVAVSDIMRFRGYSRGFCREREARALYAALPSHARVDAADDLESYERACPYGLPLTTLLPETHRMLT